MDSMQEQLASLLKTEFAIVPFAEVLRKPVTALLGVSTEAAASLNLLDVFTVFDLATSEIFAAANKILDAGQNTRSLLYQYGSASADLVRETVAGTVRIDQLGNSSIAALQRVPDNKAVTISQDLGIANIRELALYPPYKAAVKILNKVYFPENDSSVDPEHPADLLPKNGEYPTEKVQYTTLVMDEIKTGPGGIDIASTAFKPLSLAKLALEDTGFQNIAYGALVTIAQSFFAQGVTLGHLLHSVSLAPGESTRIAVVDWTRKSRAGQTEVIEEEDELDSQTSHNRALNEVTDATARDAQTGFSQSHQNSSTEAAAVAVSASASYFGLASINVSGSYSTSDSSAAADSYSTSSGSRDLSSQMAQNINDRTHQNAHSARSRRAAVVKEVSQSEHEAISTRVLANFNHMHALTIQYYEVVQIYKTRVSISKVDKVIFIPVELVDFNDDIMVHRFRNILGMASPTQEIREAIQNLDSIELAPEQGTIFSRLSDTVALASVKARPWDFRSRAITASFPTSGLRTMMAKDGALPRGDDNAETSSSGHKKAAATTVPAAVGTNILESSNFRNVLWDNGNQIMQAARMFGFQAFQKNSESIFLPNDVSIDGINIDGEGANMTPIFGLASGGTSSSLSPDQPIILSELSYIAVKGSSPDKAINVRVQIQTLRNGLRAPINLPDVTVNKAFGGNTIIVNIKAGNIKPEIKNFLMANQSFYSLAVFRSLTPTQIALLLSGHIVKIKETKPGPTPESPDVVVERSVPVSQVVEPRPIRYVGNYLAFKTNTAEDDPDWAVWLKKRGLKVGYSTEDVVTIASGGSFAEAVLGRYNCAEKLDITRFWKWDDSPVPLQPSDIAAIQAGNHNTSDGSNITPGQLSQPVINVTPPSQLPDPIGTAAVLSAIQNGNMFREMSGLQGTQQLVQSGTTTVGQEATSAGQQASANMQAMMLANTEQQRIKAQKDVAMAQLAQGSPNNSKGGENHSQDGAKINYFDSQQKAGAAAAAAAGPTAAAAGGTGAARQGGGPYIRPFDSSLSNPAFNAAVWGDGAPRSAILQRAMDMSKGESGSQPVFQNIAYTGDQALVKFWSDLLSFQVPDAVVKALAVRDIKVQKYDDAMGDLNVDLYQVEITKMPTLPGGTGSATAEDFLFYVRTHINEFIDTKLSNFYPLDNSLDKATWESKSPVGAVIRIDIPVFQALGLDNLLGRFISDNAAVVCSESDATHWRFTAVSTPYRQTGSHPVTGTREFGIKALPNNATPTGQPAGAGAASGWIFYTRAADRATGAGESILQDVSFAGGKQLWLSLRAGMKKWIKDHDGEAEEVIPEYQKVVTWPGSYWDVMDKAFKSGTMYPAAGFSTF